MAKGKSKAEMLIKMMYPNGVSKEPFSDIEEGNAEWMKFLDLLLMTLSVIQDENDPYSFERHGCRHLLAGLENTFVPSPDPGFSDKGKFRDVFRELLDRSEKTIYQGGKLPIAEPLVFRTMTESDFISVLLAFAYQTNRKYEKVFAYLQCGKDVSLNPEVSVPTVGLTADLTGLFSDDDCVLSLYENSFLNKYILNSTGFSGGFRGMTVQLILRKCALDYFSGRPMELGRFSRFCTYESVCAEYEELMAHNREAEELMLAFTADAGSKGGRLIQLCGAEGSGRTFLARFLATGLQRSLISLSVSSFFTLPYDDREEMLSELAAYCMFTGSILLLKNLPSAEKMLDVTASDRLSRLIERCCSDCGIILLESGEPVDSLVNIRADVSTIFIGETSPSVQADFWRYFMALYGIPPAEDVAVQTLTSLYNMTPGKIEAVIKRAAVILRPDKKSGKSIMDAECLRHSIRSLSRVDFGKNATLLKSTFGWDDLKLSENAESMLKEAVARIKNRSVIMSDYGFETKLPYGSGTSICLYGPPGTGKTMAALVVANDLGLDMYRVDLSQIESKYIGETQKNLGKIFDAAENSNAILFFDEADALFARRTDAGSANDRHANSQVAYLLQRMEGYRGVSILATNIAQNFDAAFKRRITYMIPVERPDETERLKIWKSVFPEDAPLDKMLNLKKLAEQADLSGSQIQSAALHASYLAAQRGSSIGMNELVEAVELEYKKEGRLTDRVVI